jgi:hypothetical protein
VPTKKCNYIEKLIINKLHLHVERWHTNIAQHLTDVPMKFLYSYIMTAQNNTIYYRSSGAWSLHILSTKVCIIIIIVYVAGG